MTKKKASKKKTNVVAAQETKQLTSIGDPKGKRRPIFEVVPNPLEEMEHVKKHGKPRAFKTPQHLWDTAMAYFQYQIDNPIIVQDYKGKDVIRVNIEKAKPWTLDGFYTFAGISSSYLRKLKQEVNDGIRDAEEWGPYLTVIAEIRKICDQQKFEGASSGIFNPNIIARSLGLADIKQEQTIDEDGNPAPANKANNTVVVLPSNNREAYNEEK